MCLYHFNLKSKTVYINSSRRCLLLFLPRLALVIVPRKAQDIQAVLSCSVLSGYLNEIEGVRRSEAESGNY